MGQAKRRKDLGLYPEKTDKRPTVAFNPARPRPVDPAFEAMLAMALHGIGGVRFMGGMRAGKTAMMKRAENFIIQGQAAERPIGFFKSHEPTMVIGEGETDVLEGRADIAFTQNGRSYSGEEVELSGGNI